MVSVRGLTGMCDHVYAGLVGANGNGAVPLIAGVTREKGGMGGGGGRATQNGTLQ